MVLYSFTHRTNESSEYKFHFMLNVFCTNEQIIREDKVVKSKIKTKGLFDVRDIKLFKDNNIEMRNMRLHGLVNIDIFTKVIHRFNNSGLSTQTSILTSTTLYWGQHTLAAWSFISWKVQSVYITTFLSLSFKSHHCARATTQRSLRELHLNNNRDQSRLRQGYVIAHLDIGCYYSHLDFNGELTKLMCAWLSISCHCMDTELLIYAVNSWSLCKHGLLH